MNVYSADYFEHLCSGTRKSAQRIVPILLELVQPNSVVDVGCGTGAWLATFQRHGVNDMLGIDGDYVAGEQLEIRHDQFLAHDLTAPIRLGRRFDLVVSLEVAEHLESRFAADFVRTLTELGPIVAFSAAVPHQGGDNHVNEQWPDYWARLFQARGFVPIDAIRRIVWDDEQVDWWYAQNLLMFVDENALGQFPRLTVEAESTPRPPLSLVHPKNLSNAIWRQETLHFCLDLMENLPLSAQIILADDGKLGDVRIGRHRNHVPFLEREGKFWGCPSDDPTAIQELERMRSAGMEFLALAWPSHWWLDHYADFSDYLRQKYSCSFQNERLVLFDLRE